MATVLLEDNVYRAKNPPYQGEHREKNKIVYEGFLAVDEPQSCQETLDGAHEYTGKARHDGSDGLNSAFLFRYIVAVDGGSLPQSGKPPSHRKNRRHDEFRWTELSILFCEE